MRRFFRRDDRSPNETRTLLSNHAKSHSHGQFLIPTTKLLFEQAIHLFSLRADYNVRTIDFVINGVDELNLLVKL